MTAVNVIYAAIGGAGFAVFGIAVMSFLFKHQKPDRNLKARPLPRPPSDAGASRDDEVAPDEDEEVDHVSEEDLDQNGEAERNERLLANRKILKRLKPKYRLKPK